MRVRAEKAPCRSASHLKIIARQMMRYLNKYNLLYKHQYGFRPKHSTSHPLIQFLSRVYSALDKEIPEYTLGIFLDLKKLLKQLIMKYCLKN